MMRLAPTLAWTLGAPARPVDRRLFALLRAVRDHGSLAAAVGHAGLSYRAAWGLLRDYEKALGAPLVRLQRGRGATLAATGVRVLEADDAASQRLAPVLSTLAIDLAPPVRPARKRGALRLRLAASHDFALIALRDALVACDPQVELDISFMGSVAALESFERDGVDLAGFHVPLPSRGVARDLAPFRDRLRPSRDRLIVFVQREQGLILARHNPARVRSLHDVARRRLRFVNRQRGSGTRLALDGLLRREGISPLRIDGYGTEEFTHRAVAATVASGSADAGFGLRAAAEEHGLAFVPLLREGYFFAVRASALRRPAIVALSAYLRSGPFAALARELPGYRARRAGSTVAVEDL